MTKERVSLRAPTCRGVAISVEETVVDIVMQASVSVASLP